ncbi:hypothetical protein [Woeseia oceani]|nr:hypothetical protein [Woeseia oceani]
MWPPNTRSCQLQAWQKKAIQEAVEYRLMMQSMIALRQRDIPLAALP